MFLINFGTKNAFYVILVIVFLPYASLAQRIAVHTITNFDLNTTANTFSFEIYSQNIGVQNIRVGLTSFYFDFKSSSFSLPVLSEINPKYTLGSPTGDYDGMTAEINLGKIAVTILFTGNGEGTGDTLSRVGPLGEHICTVSLGVTDLGAQLNLSWDQINSAMNTPTLQTISNVYQGSFVTSIANELEILRTKYELYQNYPNPFNSQTLIKFSLNSSAIVNLHIYNSNGSIVRSLINDETKGEGSYQIRWDGTNDKGKNLSSGVYFYKLMVENYSEIKSMVFQK